MSSTIDRPTSRSDDRRPQGEDPRRRRRRRGLLLAAAALLGLLAALAAFLVTRDDDARETVAGMGVLSAARGAPGWVKLGQDAPLPAWNGSLGAPRGGVASFQVVVDYARPGEQAPAVTLADLDGPGDTGALGDAVRVRRALTIPVSGTSAAVRDGLTGRLPDPLVPVDRGPRDERRQFYLVDIAVPREQSPGEYRGAIEVQAGGEPTRIPFTLRVADVTLPAERALRTLFLVWEREAAAAEGRGAADDYRALLREAGVNDGNPGSGDRLLTVSPRSGDPGDADADVDRLAREVAEEARRLREEHPGAEIYSYEFDEPEEDQFALVRRWGEALNRHAPDVRHLVVSPPVEWIDTVDTWVSHVRDLDEDGRRIARDDEATIWSYNSCCDDPGDPTLLLDAPATDHLGAPALTWLLGAEGVLYWSVNNFDGEDRYRNPHTETAGRVANGDGWLTYPGRPLGLDRPVSSLRLESFRAGLQIVDLAEMLDERGRGDEARRLLGRVVQDGEASRDEAAWRAVEAELLAALER